MCGSLQGLTPTQVTTGYELALEKVEEYLPSLVCFEVKDVRNKSEVAKGMKTAVMSKQYGHEDLLSNFIADACSKFTSSFTWKIRSKGVIPFQCVTVSILPDDNTFNVDNVRVCKILVSALLGELLSLFFAGELISIL